jgi:hypothetical protein
MKEESSLKKQDRGEGGEKEKNLLTNNLTSYNKKLSGCFVVSSQVPMKPIECFS